MFQVTKKGQGVIVRRVSFWGLVVLILWGGQSLYTWLLGPFGGAFKGLVMGGEAADARPIPVLNQRFDWAFLISWTVVLASALILHILLNRNRTAEFLIETDDEVKKVTWPSWKEAWHSSIVVVMFVVFLTSFLLISDFLLSHGIQIIL